MESNTHAWTLLQDLLIILALGIPVVAVAQKLRVPPIVGFLLVGVLLGPSGLALVANPDVVRELAEIGVVLLLFTIGLELSLTQIMKMARWVLVGGGLQVTLTLAVVASLAVALEVPPRRAVFYGALVALSSTAIVLKAYSDRDELDTPPGRVVVSILLFQDLAVVPLMLLVPVLASTGEAASVVALEVGKSLVVVASLVVLGRYLVPAVLDRVVLLRNQELFTLCVAFFGLAAAFLTASFGLSLALGAFLAGLVVSESEYGLQALSDVIPFRDTFGGIFFTSVGMLLDAGFVVRAAGWVLAATVTVILIKVAITATVVRALGRPLEASLVSGLGLAQVGEFSFVLASVGLPLGLFGANHYQFFLSASVLSMLLTPFLILGARPFAGFIARGRGRGLQLLPHERAEVAELSDHAILVGYGLSGRQLARVLREAAIPLVVLEQNAELMRRARLDGVNVFYGDGARREVLEHVGIAKARVLVIAISSANDERRGVAVARSLNPSVRIVVRTRYVGAIDDLKRLGATEVVVQEFEATLELFARVLEFYAVPSNTIQHELEALRSQHYGALRGTTAADLKLDALRHLGIHAALDLVEIEEGAQAVGENATSLNLRQVTGAVVIAVVREGKALYRASPEFQFRAGDTVVLVGDTDALDRGGAYFRAAPEGEAR